MTDPISDRLIQLGLSLPDIPTPSANYLPYIVDGLTVYLAGQINELNGKPTIVDRCLSLRGFVNTDPDFDSVPLVVNGASNLFVEIFGDAGRHVRTAIAVATLPRNGVVEIDAIFRLKA